MCVMVKCSVLFEVRIEFLNIVQTNLSLLKTDEIIVFFLDIAEDLTQRISIKHGRGGRVVKNL
jgi:hypothetical protein